MPDFITITEANDIITSPMPADETVVEVKLADGSVQRAFFSTNISEPGDWDFAPVDANDDPSEDTRVADKVIAWRQISEAVEVIKPFAADGWVLMPKDITLAMRIAAHKQAALRPSELTAIWQALLEAALSQEAVAALRHECARSGFHDHDGCSCSDGELIARQARLVSSPAPAVEPVAIKALEWAAALDQLEAIIHELASEVAPNGPEDRAWAIINKLRSALVPASPAKDKRIAELEAALEPFSTFAKHSVEPAEGGGWQWVTSGRERICDWFGPSDFGLAQHFASQPASDPRP